MKNPDLFPQVLRVLKLIYPRSFMLQYDKGQRQKADELKLAPVLVALSKIGYRVLEFALDTKNFGLPHSREHGFIVGVRNDIPGPLQDPRSATPFLNDVPKSLGAYIAGFMTPREQGRVDPRTPQGAYDMWARSWMGEHHGRMLPSLYRGEEKREEWIESWLNAGFDPREVVQEAPKVGDAEVQNAAFKPFLTFEALAVAQGFPPEWKFLAEKYGVLEMIADALPPVMAKVVALTLRSMLTGEAVELDKMMAAQVIEKSFIGLGRPPRSPFGASRRELWPGNKVREQALRVLHGESLEFVEPNHKRRGPIKEQLARLKHEQATMDAEEDAWEKRLFPNGVPA